MATGFSNNELNFARKKYYGNLHFVSENISFFQKIINITLAYIYFLKYSVLNIKRKIYRSLDIFFINKKNQNKNFHFRINLDNDSIEKISKELKSKNFIYIENFLSEDSYQFLLKSWPNINHFDHIKKIIKHYNIGFMYNYKNLSIDKTFKRYPQEFGLKQFYKFLISTRFKIFYDKLLKTKDEDYFTATILSSMASKNSYLIPHYDGVSKDNKFKNGYNFIYFVDGYEKNLSAGGATGIYQDNEFKKPLLIPKTIKNSILIYNTKSTEFYHGFKNINCPSNIYRKTINFLNLNI
jgi:hypothetical protein